MLERIDTAGLKKLRDECKTHNADSNFDQCCRILITGLALLIDEIVKAKKPTGP